MNKKILGIGNAIVDVFAKIDDEFLRKKNLIKGSMKLINKSEFEDLKKSIKIEKVAAGGSVANTMSGIAYLKGSPSFIGKINSDNFGELYKNSLKDINVEFPYIEKNEELPTGASIILITPDSERTMCTYLGISSHLSADDINENNITEHKLIFLEGYLWDKGISEKMFKHAINIAKKNKVKIAMSLVNLFFTNIFLASSSETFNLAAVASIYDCSICFASWLVGGEPVCNILLLLPGKDCSKASSHSCCLSIEELLGSP